MFRIPKSSSAGLIVYRALSDCAAKGSLFIVTILAARRLSPEAFGAFSIASTFGWILAVAADCGIQLHVARSVAVDRAGAPETLARWLRLRLETSAAAILVAIAVVVVVRPPFGTAFLLLAAAYVVSGLIEFTYYFYRGAGRTDLESSMTLVHRLSMLGCASAILVWRPTLPGIGLALLLPAIVVLLLALTAARRLAVSMRADSPSFDRRHAGIGREFLVDILPIGAGIVLSALYFRIDLFLVDAWLGQAAAGSYNAVFRIVEALRLFPAAAIAVALPVLFRAGDRKPVGRIVTWVTLFALAVSAAGIAVAPWLIPTIYGNGYASAVPAFRILLLSFPLFSVNYALTHQLIGWRGQNAYVGVCAAALAGNVALNAVLIPAEGVAGAAWATFWTELILTAGCLSALRARAPREPEHSAVAAVTP